MNAFEQAIIKKQNNHIIYDGNKIKFAKDSSTKEDDRTVFSDGFSKGLDQNTWNISGEASVVKDTTLNHNVLKIQSKTTVLSKNLAAVAHSPGFYRLTVTYKSDSTNVRPNIGFNDAGLTLFHGKVSIQNHMCLQHFRIRNLTLF